jgi:hypothetical protein
MKSHTEFFTMLNRARIFMVCIMLLATLLLLESCDKDDPERVNEEEVITTVTVTLTPDGGGIPVILKFFDEDGVNGSIDPIYTVTGPLVSSTPYSGKIELLNETEDPAEDITLEVEEEANDHLFCFTTAGNIAIDYKDADDNGLPVGITTLWVTGAPGEAEVTITLRHQSGTKTGVCPGSGESDVEVVFNVSIAQ